MTTIAQRFAGFSTKSAVAYRNDPAGALPAWKAFQSGMQILHRYAERSPVDVHTIAKSNLQLLHRSLAQSKYYSHHIEAILSKNTNQNLPMIEGLYSDQGLTAELLSLQDGASMNLISVPQRYSMYLLISGTAQLGNNGNNQRSAQQQWWKRITTINKKKYLRSGSVIIQSETQNVKQLTAQGKKCILLRVHLSMQKASCEMAS